MYEELQKQYEQLELDDKNALLIYKSRLFMFINQIDLILSSKEMLAKYEEKYKDIKKIICAPENSFIRMSIFKDIDFETYEKFLISIQKIEQKLMSIKGKIKLKEDIKVYRATTIQDISQINNLNDKKLVSTSLDVEVTDSFYQFNEGFNILYQFSLKKGTSCLVIPYSIKIYDVENKQLLKVVASDSQKEIVLYGDSLNYSITEQKYFEDENVTIVKMNTEPIETKYLK